MPVEAQRDSQGIYRITNVGNYDGTVCIDGVNEVLKPPYQKKILPVHAPINALGTLRDFYNLRGDRIAFTAGTFDLAHPGHARYLALAKSLGDILVVGLNTDDSVGRYKNDDPDIPRPIIDQHSRGEMLAHFGMVDWVVIFNEDYSDEVIRRLRPDRFLCIEEGQWVGKLPERPEVKAVHAYGGQVFCAPRQAPGISTTKIVYQLVEAGRTKEKRQNNGTTKESANGTKLLKEFHERVGQDGESTQPS